MDFFKIIELTGVVFWVAYLLLVIKESIWCWIFGITASLITILLFYHSKIYLEAILNIYYVAAGCYGWYYWIKAGKEAASAKKKAPVVVWSLQKHLLTFALAVIVWGILSFIMHKYTDSPRPQVDAATATFSFLATFMETRKVLTCWIYWFLINGVLVWLQMDRGIYLYAGLSAFYAIMSIPGFLSWRKSYHTQAIEKNINQQ